jgi:hypothetical protein
VYNTFRLHSIHQDKVSGVSTNEITDYCLAPALSALRRHGAAKATGSINGKAQRAEAISLSIHDGRPA